MQWVTLGISLIALVASFFSIYQNWLSPANIEVVPGNPLFLKSKTDSGSYATTPMIPIDFVNKGARGGTIKQIFILVKSKSKSWVLRPQYFCSEFGMAAAKSSDREAFHPIHVPGRKEIYKVVLFNPWNFKNVGFPNFSSVSEIPSEENWTLEYYLLEGSSSEYKFACKHNFKVTAMDLWERALIPDEQSTIESTNNLFDSVF